AAVRVRANRRRVHRVVLERLTDMPARGWWSGDLHVHMNYGGAYRNTPRRLAFQARAEDVHVVWNLIVNKEQRIPGIASFRVGPDSVSSQRWLLLHGQEFHTSVWGHMGLLGLESHYLLPDYAGYPNTPFASLAPSNARVADLAHEQGALVGYVHPFDTPPDPADTTTPLSSELPVDVALGKIDYLEVMGYSDHLATSEIWYRLLNCGFRLPAGAGTDAFPNFASLRGPPGLVRVFVRAGATLDHQRWLEGLKAGRTFVTNGPLLEFSLAGRAIGDEVRLPAGRHRLTARVRLRSNVPVDHLELIGNGRVVATIPLRDRGTSSATDSVSIEVSESGWYVLRAYADRATTPVLDVYPFASTSPIYVEVGGAPVRSRSDAAYFIRWIGRVEAVARASRAWNRPEELADVLRAVAKARSVFEARARH
ncbi:MAG: CehA/McbA family metallohydrolase, partial [Gemmatimonadales bacterium]